MIPLFTTVILLQKYVSPVVFSLLEDTYLDIAQ